MNLLAPKFVFGFEIDHIQQGEYLTWNLFFLILRMFVIKIE